MRIRLFARPLFWALALLPALCLPVQAVEEDFSFSSGGRPILRIAYIAGTKGELYPCPT